MQIACKLTGRMSPRAEIFGGSSPSAAQSWRLCL